MSTVYVRCFGEKVRDARLTRFGHVQRRDSEYIGRTIRFELPCRGPRGRQKWRFMDAVKEDRKLVGV